MTNSQNLPWEEEFELKKEKFRSNKFQVSDLPEYLQPKVVPGAKVFSLKRYVPQKVSDYFLMLVDDYIAMDDAWIDVVVVPDPGFWWFIVLPFTIFHAKQVEVTSWSKIPGTNIVFDMWFVGDSVNRTPLVFEVVD